MHDEMNDAELEAVVAGASKAPVVVTKDGKQGGWFRSLFQTRAGSTYTAPAETTCGPSGCSV